MYYISGGTYAAMGDAECTHLIIDEAVKELPSDIPLPKHVVKGEVIVLTFWISYSTIRMTLKTADSFINIEKLLSYWAVGKCKSAHEIFVNVSS